MTNKNILFMVLIILFVVTALVTLLGVLNVVEINDFYLKGLFGAFLLELAATIFGITMKGNILEEAPPPERKNEPRTASLKLHIWGDHRSPDRISDNNIFRWYYLQNIMQGISAPGEPVRQHTFCTLFISFESDVAVSTVKVSSPDMELPLHEVKDFNQRYVIIAFLDAVSAGTLDINVEL